MVSQGLLWARFMPGPEGTGVQSLYGAGHRATVMGKGPGTSGLGKVPVQSSWHEQVRAEMAKGLPAR